MEFPLCIILREMKRALFLSSCTVLALSMVACAPTTYRKGPYGQPFADFDEMQKRMYESFDHELRSGGALRYEWGNPGTLPPYVFAEQINWRSEFVDAEIWRTDTVEFLPVYQSGMNSSALFGGDYGYAGILARVRGTDLWYDFFRVPIQYVATTNEDGRDHLHFTDKNVLGAFIQDKSLFVDVADNDGGGSGEGTMTRFIFDGDGWFYGGCFYFHGFLPQPNASGLHYDPFGQAARPREECLL